MRVFVIVFLNTDFSKMGNNSLKKHKFSLVSLVTISFLIVALNQDQDPCKPHFQGNRKRRIIRRGYCLEIKLAQEQTVGENDVSEIMHYVH